MSLGRLHYLILAAGAAGLIAAILFLGGSGERQVRTSLAVSEALSMDTSGYRRAVEPRSLRFPDDHGAHPDFRTEWWYYTGNLESSDGRHFGYQLTVFRTALRPDTLEEGIDEAGVSSEGSEEPADWSTRQLYMAHFAVSEAESERFVTAERFSRGAAGLAGARAEPYRVWLDDWSISGTDADSVRLVAAFEDVAIDLALVRRKPIILQGEQGLDQKGPEAGNASYYYSMTRLQTSGSVIFEGETFSVNGLSWMDHEWSTSALGEGLVGWDWFALQLDADREIMYYRLRTDAGGSSPFSGGVVVDPEGSLSPLDQTDVELESIDHWQSPETGNRYPVEWSFRIPSLDVDLHVEAFLRNQEMLHSVTYWEGAVRVSGSEEGVGFVELTGYGASDGSFAVR